jgi:hypothetical protein
MFCIKLQVLLKVFSFFLVEIQLFILVVENSHLLGAIMSGFKDGGQVIVPVLLEFTDQALDMYMQLSFSFNVKVNLF